MAEEKPATESSGAINREEKKITMRQDEPEVHVEKSSINEQNVDTQNSDHPSLDIVKEAKAIKVVFEDNDEINFIKSTVDQESTATIKGQEIAQAEATEQEDSTYDQSQSLDIEDKKDIIPMAESQHAEVRPDEPIKNIILPSEPTVIVDEANYGDEKIAITPENNLSEDTKSEPEDRVHSELEIHTEMLTVVEQTEVPQENIDRAYIDHATEESPVAEHQGNSELPETVILEGSTEAQEPSISIDERSEELPVSLSYYPEVNEPIEVEPNENPLEVKRAVETLSSFEKFIISMEELDADEAQSEVFHEKVVKIHELTKQIEESELLGTIQEKTKLEAELIKEFCGVLELMWIPYDEADIKKIATIWIEKDILTSHEFSDLRDELYAEDGMHEIIQKFVASLTIVKRLLMRTHEEIGKLVVSSLHKRHAIPVTVED